MVNQICKPVLEKEIFTCISLKNNESFIFSEVFLNADDTIEDVLNKIMIYSSAEQRDYKYVFAYYLDDGIIKPLGFDYPNITFKDIYHSDEDCIDDLFVDTDGVKKYIPLEKYYSSTLETFHIKDKTIYCLTIDNFLEKKKLKEKIIKNKLELSDDLINSETTLSRFNNGLIKKYWPMINNFTTSYSKSVIQEDKKEFTRVKENTEIYSSRINAIDDYYKKNNGDYDDCNFTITIMKLMKKKDIMKENQMKLIELFSDFELSKEFPFIKIMFDSHEDNMYKIFENSLDINGGNVTKEMCKAWTDDFKIQEYYGYNYIYSGNLVEIKIHHNDMYLSLIIKKDGSIECVIDNNNNIMNQEDIISLIRICNGFIEKEINAKNIYSYKREPLEIFDLDFFTNHLSETKLDFINCGMFYSLEKEKLENWGKFFDVFFSNHPLFFRKRQDLEFEDDVDFKRMKSVFRSFQYIRVNNYRNMSSIQSMISSLSNPTNKLYKEDIINQIVEAFNISEDRSRIEYELFLEQAQQRLDKEQNVYIKLPNEEGATINIYEPSEKDNLNLEKLGFDGLLFDFKNIKSFSDFRRISIIISSMINIYQSKKELYQLFTKLNKKIAEEVQIIEDQKPDDPTHNEVINKVIVETSESESYDSDLLDELGESSSSEGLDGGVKDKNEIKIKSYYNDRLKKYDKDLFVFESLEKQPSGVKKGYTKYCTMSPARGHRQPIAITTKELNEIKKNDKIHGKSYGNSLHVKGRSKDIHYICPKYWDIKTNRSLNPENIDEFKGRIIPQDFKKINADSDKSIIERRFGIWEGEKDINKFRVGVSSKSYSYHPEGYGLPCCFNPVKDRIKKDEKIEEGDNSSEESGETIGEKGNVVYISKEEPIIIPGRYAHINPSIRNFLGDNIQDIEKQKLNKRYLDRSKETYREGFLKVGVVQNEGSMNFKESPFLNSFLKCCSKEIKKNTSESLIQHIVEVLEKNPTLYQKSPEVVSAFMRVSDEKSLSSDIDYFIKIFKGSEKIKEDPAKFLMNSKNYYQFTLSLSLNNYIQFLKNTTENRNDNYIVPILKQVFKNINIIIFENVNDEIRIKNTETLYKDKDKKFILIYKGEKKGKVFYEPIIYRVFKAKGNPTEYGILEMDINERINNIISEIEHKIPHRQNRITRLIEDPKEILFFIIDKLSYVSHIGLKNKNKDIIPIIPERIPFEWNRNHFKLIYDVKQTEYSSITEDYLKKYDLQIEGIIVNKDRKLCNVIFNDGLYIPIKEIPYDIKIMPYPIQGENDILKIENNLFKENNDDKRKTFYDYHKYEKYITNLAFHHIVQEIYNNNIVIKENYIRNKEDFYIGQTIYATYEKEIVDGEEKEFIKQLNITDHNYFNYSVIGNVKDIKDDKIILEIDTKDIIKSIIDDEIKINHDKKKALKKIIEDLTDHLFVKLSEEDYQKYKEKKTKQLCSSINKSDCNYPCKMDDESCRLLIKDKDLEGNDLKEKIILLFIEKLLIHKIDKIDNIIREEINIDDLRKTAKRGEIFYTFIDYDKQMEQSKGSLFLYNLFIKRSRFYKDSHKLVRKEKHGVIRSERIPNYVYKILGENTKILIQIEEDDIDFLTLQRALNNVLPGEMFDIIKIKTIMEKITGNNYEDKNHRVSLEELSLIVDELTDICFFIIVNDGKNYKVSLKYNRKKFNDLTKIIPFYINNQEGLCNVLLENEYYFTRNEISGNQRLKKEIDDLLEVTENI